MLNSLPLAKYMLILFYWTGWFLTPISNNPIPYEQEVIDVWTLGHLGAGYMLSDYLYKHTKLTPEQSAVASYLVLYSYELFIDGFKIEDPRGFSYSDIGANVWGIFINYIITKTSHKKWIAMGGYHDKIFTFAVYSRF